MLASSGPCFRSRTASEVAPNFRYNQVILARIGPLAQMDRATAYEAVGRVFESPRARHPAYISAFLPLLNLFYIQPQPHYHQPNRYKRKREADAPVIAFG